MKSCTSFRAKKTAGRSAFLKQNLKTELLFYILIAVAGAIFIRYFRYELTM